MRAVVVSSPARERIAGGRGMKGILALLAVVFLLSCSGGDADPSDPSGREGAQHGPASFLPTLLYKHESIRGFAVFIHPEVLEHSLEASELRKELDGQLAALKSVAPPDALAFLKQVPIWVEWENRREGAAEFHVSVIWLKANGYNPDKAGGIEINNTRNFVDWSRHGQPWMILHELSHAYYDQVLAWRWNEVAAAYEQAVTDGLYDPVAHVDGGQYRAYALTNQSEYFAELSEAYFGKNDFFPFTRDELEEYDPRGFQLMLGTWGELQATE